MSVEAQKDELVENYGIDTCTGVAAGSGLSSQANTAFLLAGVSMRDIILGTELVRFASSSCWLSSEAVTGAYK